MLRIHDVMLDALRTMRPALAAIQRNDSDLARQLRRAASSVALNLAEGSGSAGGVRQVRYRTALGSARETLSCLQVAGASATSTRSAPTSSPVFTASSERSSASRPNSAAGRPAPAACIAPRGPSLSPRQPSFPQDS